MLLQKDGTIKIPFKNICKDETIFDALEDWGGFTAQQGALICDRGYSVFRHRLAHLYDKGKIGVAGRAAIYDFSTAFPRFYIPESRELGYTNILHEYELTQVRLALHIALKGSYSWYRRELEFGEFKPDGVFNIDSQAWHGFALELERSRPSGSRPSKEDPKVINSLFKKAASFIRFRNDYLKLKPQERTWRDIDDFHLLFVLSNCTQRKLNFWLERFGAEEAGRYKLRTYRFCMYEDFLKDPLGHIWKTPRDYETTSYSLLD